MITTRIQGIPCQVNVTAFTRVSPWKGSAHTCPSSCDYYGYSEIEFDVYDRKGYRARWLERKMTLADKKRIESEILESRKDDAR